MHDKKQLVKEYFEAAPDNIREVIKNVSNQPNIINSIATKNGINPAQTAALKTEIFLTLLGLESITNFRNNIVRELEITYDQALKISADANQQIFNPVMETLRGMEAEGESEDVVENREDYDEVGGEMIGDLISNHPPVTKPEKLIPDHAEMTKTDGPHLHSQNVMPTQSKPTPVAATAAPKPATIPNNPLKSIVDQKLSGLVRSTNTSNTSSAPTSRPPANLPTGYKGNDPYREPLN